MLYYNNACCSLQAFRRFGYSLKSARQALQLWQGTMKEIGGKFGTSVLNYFLFLKFLLMFNILSFLINFGFITIPLLVYDPTPNVTGAVRFRGLEILTGAVSVQLKCYFFLQSLIYLVIYSFGCKLFKFLNYFIYINSPLN